MFYSPANYPFTTVLESNWQIIRQEFEQLKPEDLVAWPEKDLYKQGWDVFGLWALGRRLDENCRLCPQTSAVVESIPGLTTVGFSRLAPGSRILPHVGYTNTVLRCHLGIIVPEGCGIQVGEEICTWQEGKCLVFDDTTQHSAWNDSQQSRIVLLADFVRPGKVFDATVSAASEAVDAVIGKVNSRHE